MKIDVRRVGTITFNEAAELVANIWIGGAPGIPRKEVTITCTIGAAASAIFEGQKTNPEDLPELETALWAYRGSVYNISGDVSPLLSAAQVSLLVRNAALKDDQEWDRLERAVTTAEQLVELSSYKREPISEAVRMFVWRRDQGRCTKCGSSEKLEFDHIIPHSKGGGNSERNIQLLCEPCNRSKSAKI